MKYFEWEGAVAEAVAEALQVSYSDASGVVEAQLVCMKQSWDQGLDAQQAATKILVAAQAE